MRPKLIFDRKKLIVIFLGGYIFSCVPPYNCKSCLIRVYSVCLWKYDLSVTTPVDLTSNLFVLCTNMKVYLYIYS